MTFADAPLEKVPTDDQKERLEDWLQELKLICAKYQMLPDTDSGEVRIIDLKTGHVIGFGLCHLRDRERPEWIRALDLDGSILDGVWLVDTGDGEREQRDVMNVWPTRTIN